MSTPYDGPDNRAEYLATESFLLHTQVGVESFDEISRQRPPRIRELPSELLYGSSYTEEAIRANPAEASLFMASQRLISLVKFRDADTSKFDKRYGINNIDLGTATRFDSFNYGFADPDFPWHFAPPIAAAVAHTFEAEGIITPEEHKGMTLGDWANIIGTGWFSDLMHSMAFTSNGVYMTFGKNFEQYGPDSLRSMLARNDIHYDGHAFELTQQEEPQTGEVYWTADLKKPIKVALRRKITDKKYSVGCPVAREGTKLHEDLLENPHAKALLECGQIKVSKDADPTDDDIRVEQEYTAIDISLMVLAEQLERYSRIYGEPVVETRSYPEYNELRHKRSLGATITDKLVSKKPVEDETSQEDTAVA